MFDSGLACSSVDFCDLSPFGYGSPPCPLGNARRNINRLFYSSIVRPTRERMACIANVSDGKAMLGLPRFRATLVAEHIEMFSSNSICFEGICRLFRNSTLNHIRQVLKASYPEDWFSRVQKPFAKEWDGIQQNADIRRSTGELGGALIDELDALGVNHFFNLFDIFYDELFPPSNTDTAEVRRQTKQAVLGWSRNSSN